MDEIHEETEARSEVPQERLAQFEIFCQAHGEKVNRIGRFIRNIGARENYCREEAARLGDRARVAANKVSRTKTTILAYLSSHELRRLEGLQFTLRRQENSQASVHITGDTLLPMSYRRIEIKVEGVLWERVLSHLPSELSAMFVESVRGTEPDDEAIKSAVKRDEDVPGANVRKGWHLRVA